MIIGFIDEYRKAECLRRQADLPCAHRARNPDRAADLPQGPRTSALAAGFGRGHAENALRALCGLPEEMHGRRKMTRYLRRQGHDIAFCTTDRTMRRLGMNGVARGRRLRTTIPAKDAVRAADLHAVRVSAPEGSRLDAIRAKVS